MLDPGYGGALSDAFGTAVALNGTTLAVGAPGAAGGLGAVYIYRRTGTTWTQQAVLTPTDATQPENFATALALSGTTLAVGADYQNNGEGGVYVYVDSNGVWQQQAELRYPGRYLFANFGNRVAVWGDTVLVAAPGAPVAFVYARTGTTWTLQAVLAAPHSPLSFFGHGIALWGTTALVSACCFNGSVNGVVYVFTRSGSAWSLRAALTPPGGALNFVFGEDVALSYHTAVVGNNGAYVYVGSGASWALQAQLMPSDRPPHDLGAAVAIQGNTALVADTGGTPPVGPTGFVFVRSGTDWASADTTSMSRTVPTQQGNRRPPSVRTGAASSRSSG